MQITQDLWVLEYALFTEGIGEQYRKINKRHSAVIIKVKD
jgi:hypothetical protein